MTNAFSENDESQLHMVALYTVFYDFIRMYKLLRITPAMTSGVADRLWSMEDIAELVEAAAPLTGAAEDLQKARCRVATRD